MYWKWWTSWGLPPPPIANGSQLEGDHHTSWPECSSTRQITQNETKHQSTSGCEGRRIGQMSWHTTTPASSIGWTQPPAQLKTVMYLWCTECTLFFRNGTRCMV